MDWKSISTSSRRRDFRSGPSSWSRVLESRSINWTQMFMDLEKTLPPGVHVLHIEPKLEKGVVSVHFVVGATSEDAKLKLLKAFETSASFSHVELLSERVATQPGFDPVTIEFEAEYPNT